MNEVHEHSLGIAGDSSVSTWPFSLQMAKADSTWFVFPCTQIRDMIDTCHPVQLFGHGRWN